MAAPQAALRRAREDPLPELDLESPERGLRAQGPRKARGVDGPGSTDLVRLPAGGLGELRQLQKACEQHDGWPRQLLGAIGATPPRSAGGGRIIVAAAAQGLVAGEVVRHGGLGGGPGRVRGHGHPRPQRSARGLAARGHGRDGRGAGVAAFAQHMGVETFYELVSLVKAMAIAERSEYPAAAIGLEVQLLLAPRFLRDRRHGVPGAVEATRSVLAGSGHGPRGVAREAAPPPAPAAGKGAVPASWAATTRWPASRAPRQRRKPSSRRSRGP